jgi:hypothetical protein
MYIVNLYAKLHIYLIFKKIDKNSAKTYDN